MAKPSHLFVFLFDIRCISDSITTTQMRDKYVMYTKWSLQQTKILKGIIMRQCTTMQCYGAVLCALNNASAPCRRGQCCVAAVTSFIFIYFFGFLFCFHKMHSVNISGSIDWNASECTLNLISIIVLEWMDLRPQKCNEMKNERKLIRCLSATW